MFTDIEIEEMAVLAIYNYFDGEYTKEQIEKDFNLAVKLLVSNAKKMLTMKVAGVNSITQGSQSISFESGVEVFTLTSDVLALLPKKKTFKVW